MTISPRKTAMIRVFKDDIKYLKEMQTRMVMQDGKARGLPTVLHTILYNARFIVGDVNLIKEPPK